MNISQVKSYFWLVGLATLMGCAGERGDLEEAAYLLGKGGTANAAAAFNLVQPLISSEDADIKLEAIRLYAGAQMARAGFDSIKITSNLVFKESNDTVAILKSAVTLDTDALALLNDVETRLSNLITSDAAFSGASTEKQKDLTFLLGLNYLFQAARTALVAGGITTTVSTYDQSACETSVNANLAQIGTLNSDLTLSESKLNDSGLVDANPVVELVSNFRAEVPATATPTTDEITALCQYLVAQNGL